MVLGIFIYLFGVLSGVILLWYFTREKEQYVAKNDGYTTKTHKAQQPHPVIEDSKAFIPTVNITKTDNATLYDVSTQKQTKDIKSTAKKLDKVME